MRDSHWITIAKLLLCRTFLGDAIGHIPFVKRAYSSYTYKRTDHGALFVGIFPSYLEALNNIPSDYNKGWDNDKSSRIWITHSDFLQPTTYTVFFWLNNLLSEGCLQILDYGGSIGLSYYAYKQRSPLGPVTWTVAEVPNLVKQGQLLASEKGESQRLRFVVSNERLPACQILYSGGALQFDENGVPGILERIDNQPSHILLNKVPLTDRPSYWTTHNFGTAIAPYKVFNRSEFIGYFEDRGYSIKDSWQVFDMSVDIPFHSEECVPHFSGFYMAHKDTFPGCE